jgi:hypothetical protein
MSLHVSAHRAIIRQYITKLILLNYASYMDPYIVLIFVCYNTLALLITFICTDWVVVFCDVRSCSLVVVR